MERFGALGYDLCKNTHGEDMKRSLRNQICKTMNAMDLDQFCWPKCFHTSTRTEP